MLTADDQVKRLVNQYPDVQMAYLDLTTSPPTLHVYLTRNTRPTALQLPPVLTGCRLETHTTVAFHDLRIPSSCPLADTPEQRCQNEPIALGTQIQPADANWLGTAGAPCRWTDANAQPHWGILSNWHVIADGNERKGRAIHQPTRAHRLMARLHAWEPVRANVTNQIDAAIADTYVDGAHTTAFSIIGLDTLNPKPFPGALNLPVQKTGRTTGTTAALCSGVNAVAKIGYGDFTALFTGLDVFTDQGGPFAGPGDSGSLIVARASRCPTSLLFAGGGNLTLGIPIVKIMQRFNLTFQP